MLPMLSVKLSICLLLAALYGLLRRYKVENKHLVWYHCNSALSHGDHSTHTRRSTVTCTGLGPVHSARAPATTKTG